MDNEQNEILKELKNLNINNKSIIGMMFLILMLLGVLTGYLIAAL